MYVHDVVEAHCYVVDIGRTYHEQIRSSYVSAHDKFARYVRRCLHSLVLVDCTELPLWCTLRMYVCVLSCLCVYCTWNVCVCKCLTLLCSGEEWSYVQNNITAYLHTPCCYILETAQCSSIQGHPWVVRWELDGIKVNISYCVCLRENLAHGIYI